jgi:hypothetical protein
MLFIEPPPLGQYRWEGRLVTGTDGKNLLSMTRDGALTKTPFEKNTIDRIDELEKTTRHDVLAFVTNVAENVGEP